MKKYFTFKDMNLLTRACNSGSLDIVKILLNHPGIDVHCIGHKSIGPLQAAIIRLGSSVKHRQLNMALAFMEIILAILEHPKFKIENCDVDLNALNLIYVTSLN